MPRGGSDTPSRSSNLVRLSTPLRGAGAAVVLRTVGRQSRALLRRLGLEATELSIRLVGDAEIRRINRCWRGKDAPTDVLSFPSGAMRVPGQRWPVGDLVVSLVTARRAAAEHGEALDRELHRYLAHGLLHLLGHDHQRKVDARRMARAERRLLGFAGMLADSDEI